MKGVPPEVDRLMWAVAEDGRDQAIHEFAGRYPQHRAELMHRVNMVAGLRNQVRQPTEQNHRIPRFERREPAQSINPRAVFLTGALGLAAIAAASYTASVALRPIANPPRQVVPPVETRLTSVPQPVYANSLPAPEAVRPSQPDDKPLPEYGKPEPRIELKDVKLTDALKLITAGTGMTLEIGPGFVDQAISVDYEGASPLDALQDMAKKYAFTLFDEGDGHFLVLPVADSSSAATPVDSALAKRISP